MKEGNMHHKEHKQKLKTWKEIPIGGKILEAGNSKEYKTGDWRTFRPIHIPEKCTNCMICWMICPDSCVNVGGVDDPNKGGLLTQNEQILIQWLWTQGSSN